MRTPEETFVHKLAADLQDQIGPLKDVRSYTLNNTGWSRKDREFPYIARLLSGVTTKTSYHTQSDFVLATGEVIYLIEYETLRRDKLCFFWNPDEDMSGLQVSNIYSIDSIARGSTIAGASAIKRVKFRLPKSWPTFIKRLEDIHREWE